MLATSNSLPQPHLDGSPSPQFSSFGVVAKRTSKYFITIASSSVAHSWNGARATCCLLPQPNGGPSWETCTGSHSGPNEMIQRLQLLSTMFSGNTGALFFLVIHGVQRSPQGIMPPRACYLAAVMSRCPQLMIQTSIK